MTKFRTLALATSVNFFDLRNPTRSQQTLGDVTDRVHVILRQVRIPVGDFAAQGVDMTSLRSIAFDFGGSGMPQSGSIQLADVRFQEAVSGPTVYAESASANGPATDALAVQHDNAPATAAIDATPRAVARRACRA